jgi:hypothetical protein
MNREKMTRPKALEDWQRTQHTYERDPYWVNCGRYDGYWTSQCKKCGGIRRQGIHTDWDGIDG